MLMSIVILISHSYSLSAITINVEPNSLDESVFSYDQNSIDLALEELNELDNYLNLNTGLTYEDLHSVGNNLITNISDVAAPFGQDEEEKSEVPLGIPAFWWGCFLGWIGILLVYIFTDNDKEQTGKAFKGFLVMLGTTTILSVIFIVAVLIFAESEMDY